MELAVQERLAVSPIRKGIEDTGCSVMVTSAVKKGGGGGEGGGGGGGEAE